MSLKNKIPLIGIIGIGLTTVIGSGIWKDSLIWSNSVGIFSLVTIIIGWLLFLCAGLSYAECVSMFPKSGGPYSYVGGVFGKKAGSIVGVLYLIGYFFVASILAFLTALFTLAAIDVNLLTTLNLTLLTLGFLVVFGIMAGFSNPRVFGFISFGWVVIKIILVIVVTIFALTKWNYTPPATPLAFTDFQGAINAGLWALMGFEVMLVFSGDVENVERKMPKGILITLPIILVLYLFVSLGSSGIISAGEIADTSSSVGLIFLLAAKINVPAEAIFAFAAFSAAGTGYAMITMCFKQMKVLANDDVLPPIFKKEAFGFSYFNGLVILLSTLTIGGVMVGTSEVWSSSIDSFAAAGLGIILISALLPAGIIALYLRIKIPALTRPFKTPVYFIVFPLAIILCLYLIVINFWDIVNLWPGLLIFGIITILCSVLLYFLAPKEQETPAA